MKSCPLLMYKKITYFFQFSTITNILPLHLIINCWLTWTNCFFKFKSILKLALKRLTSKKINSCYFIFKTFYRNVSISISYFHFYQSSLVLNIFEHLFYTIPIDKLKHTSFSTSIETNMYFSLSLKLTDLSVI